MTDVELQDLRERWLACKAAIENIGHVMARILGPAFEKIRQSVLFLTEIVRRAYLYQSLPRWMPEAVRAWLARHWPRALLPELAEAIEWMKAEAAQ